MTHKLLLGLFLLMSPSLLALTLNDLAIPLLEGHYQSHFVEVDRGEKRIEFRVDDVETRRFYEQKGFSCGEFFNRISCEKILNLSALEVVDQKAFQEAHQQLKDRYNQVTYQFYSSPEDPELVFNSDFLKIWNVYQKVLIRKNQVEYNLKYSLLQKKDWSVQLSSEPEPWRLISSSTLQSDRSYLSREDEFEYRWYFRVQLLKTKPTPLPGFLETARAFLLRFRL